MEPDDPLIEVFLAKIRDLSRTHLVGVECVSTGPLTVSINGSTTAVPAETLTGISWTPGDTGRALWEPPGKPLCFKVST
jgi:hypothetical protein